MASELTSQSPVPATAQPTDQIDPHGYLRVGMRVIGGQSTPLGKVESFERGACGTLTAVTVRRGVFGKKRTMIPARQVKWVNQDSVVLELSRSNFRRLGLDQIAEAQPGR